MAKVKKIEPVVKNTTVFSLSVNDRIAIAAISPGKDNMDRLMVRKGLLEKVKLSEGEREESGLEMTADGGFKWKKDIEKDIDFTDPEKHYVKSLLVRLNEKNEVYDNWMNIYNLFVK